MRTRKNISSASEGNKRTQFEESPTHSTAHKFHLQMESAHCNEYSIMNGSHQREKTVAAQDAAQSLLQIHATQTTKPYTQLLMGNSGKKTTKKQQQLQVPYTSTLTTKGKQVRALSRSYDTIGNNCPSYPPLEETFPISYMPHSQSKTAIDPPPGADNVDVASSANSTYQQQETVITPTRFMPHSQSTTPFDPPSGADNVVVASSDNSRYQQESISPIPLMHISEAMTIVNPPSGADNVVVASSDNSRYQQETINPRNQENEVPWKTIVLGAQVDMPTNKNSTTYVAMPTPCSSTSAGKKTAHESNNYAPEDWNKRYEEAVRYFDCPSDYSETYAMRVKEWTKTLDSEKMSEEMQNKCEIFVKFADISKAPSAPVAPATSIAPATSVAPVAPVAPAAPVANAAPVAPTAPEALQNPEKIQKKYTPSPSTWYKRYEEAKLYVESPSDCSKAFEKKVKQWIYNLRKQNMTQDMQEKAWNIGIYAMYTNEEMIARYSIENCNELACQNWKKYYLQKRGTFSEEQKAELIEKEIFTKTELRKPINQKRNKKRQNDEI